MTFQLLSDLHLEFYPKFESQILPLLESKADYLILAGDICEAKNYQKFEWFFLWCNDNYTKTFYVLGNHEYYNSNDATLLINYNYNANIKDKANQSIPIPQQIFQEFCTFNNLDKIVICKDFEPIDLGEDTIIMGDTTWTNFYNGDPLAMMNCDTMMNDNRVGCTPSSLTYNWHLQAIEKLTNQLSKISNIDTKIVLFTHHPITEQCVAPKYIGSKIGAGFTSNYDQLIIDNPNIKYICSGHTHEKWKGEIGQSKYIINPLGYPGESSEHKIEPLFFDV
jgi:predicted MPP superfamily phosphohydrolase